MAKNIFNGLVQVLIELPLWVKECVYIELLENLKKDTMGILPQSQEELYPYYVPGITYLGKQELASKSKEHSPNLYKFMQGASSGLNIVEITLNNHWTLEEAAVMNIECINNEYVVAPDKPAIMAMALYCAGQIRIGEYLKRLNIIDIDQLDTALRRQKELENSGTWTKMVEILIELGYVTKEDTRTVLYIKEESKKRYVISASVLGSDNIDNKPDNVVNMDSGQCDAVEETSSGFGIDPAIYAKVVRENKILKEKIKGIIAVIQGK